MFLIKRCLITCLFFLLYLVAGFWPAVSLADNHTSVAVVFSSDRPPYFEAWEGFRSRLGEVDIPVSFQRYRLSEGEGQEIIQKIKESNPDLVLTIGSKAAKMAKVSIHDIPVVFCMVLHPENFAAPNITGVPINVPFFRKLKALREIIPEVNKIGIIYTEEDAAEYKELNSVANEYGVELMEKEVASAKELTNAVDEMFWQIDTFLILPISRLYFPQSVKYIIQEGLRRKVPVIGLSSAYTKAGSLISFQYDYKDLGHNAAELAAQILRGKNPGDLQPSRPAEVQYSLNLDVARKIGLEIPVSSVSGAAEVFPK